MKTMNWLFALLGSATFGAHAFVRLRQRRALVLALLAALATSGWADTVGGNVFLQGNYVEVGIHPSGSFGSSVNAPAGFHARMLRRAFTRVAEAGDWAS